MKGIIRDPDCKQLCIEQVIFDIGGLFSCLQSREIIEPDIQSSWLDYNLKIVLLEQQQPSTIFHPKTSLFTKYFSGVISEHLEMCSQQAVPELL